jgi:hypothetical protein
MTQVRTDAIVRPEATRFRVRSSSQEHESQNWTYSRVSEGILMIPSDWIYSGLMDLIVLSLVWGTVLAGLILIVRERVDNDDLSEYR